MAAIAQTLSDAQAIADLVVVLRLQLDRALCLARLQDCQPHVESRHAIGGGGQRLLALVEVSHHMFGLIEEHVPSLEGEHLLFFPPAPLNVKAPCVLGSNPFGSSLAVMPNCSVPFGPTRSLREAAGAPGAIPQDQISVC